jgi:S1-C subfamily serine protease
MSVERGSPAEKAELRDGDVIVGYGSKPVGSVDDLHRILTEEHVGAASEITVLRNTEKHVKMIVPTRADSQ